MASVATVGIVWQCHCEKLFNLSLHDVRRQCVRFEMHFIAHKSTLECLWELAILILSYQTWARMSPCSVLFPLIACVVPTATLRFHCVHTPRMYRARTSKPDRVVLEPPCDRGMLLNRLGCVWEWVFSSALFTHLQVGFSIHYPSNPLVSKPPSSL